MTIEEAVSYYGTAVKLCRELGIAKQNVTHWRKRGYIPFYQQLRIQEFSDGQLKADAGGRENE